MDYPALAARIASLTAGETDSVALMATVACEVHHSDDRFDWTGFYRVVEPGLLKIGPYQGGHGCRVIPSGKGVCGAVAQSRKALIVPDVEPLPGHIACASTTRSEIVLPVRDGSGVLIAVLDIDSNRPDAFGAADRAGLETILRDTFERG